MGKNAKLKEKQKWSEEKLHLENARKLGGIYFIDLEVPVPDITAELSGRDYEFRKPTQRREQTVKSEDFS